MLAFPILIGLAACLGLAGIVHLAEAASNWAPVNPPATLRFAAVVELAAAATLLIGAALVAALS